MTISICLLANTVGYSHGGGHAWTYLNWALGFRSLGCRVIWLELIAPDAARAQITSLENRLKHYGLLRDLALCSTEGERLDTCDYLDLEDAAEADLLLNMRYGASAEIVSRFKRSVLLDIDPGLLQIWISRGQIEVARHDFYFTIGETVGFANALVPNCGLAWHYTPPCVALDWWRPQVAAEDAAFTTVSHWYADEWVEDAAGAYENNKRSSFLPYLDLPRFVPDRLELALSLGEDEVNEVEELQTRGWRVCHATDVASTPWDYHHYLQRSRGEFSCAKPSCMRLQNGWISDRTLCYLASGKPVIVQHTGKSSFLPDCAGMFRFRNLAEAIECFDCVRADYASHCVHARGLAEEFFDGAKVAGSLLDATITCRSRPSKVPLAQSSSPFPLYDLSVPFREMKPTMGVLPRSSVGHRLIVLGMMGRCPFGGQTWLYLNWLRGLHLLGHEVWYVEDDTVWPYDPVQNTITDDCSYAVRHLAECMDRIGLPGRWAFRLADRQDACWGLSEPQLVELYRSCDALLNIVGATDLRDEQLAASYRVYIETDPVTAELRLATGDEHTRVAFENHDVIATYGENYGAPDCGVPLNNLDWKYRKTRQPIDTGLWPIAFNTNAKFITTMGNWKQEGNDVPYAGEVYRWSKHHEWEKFLDLPLRTTQPFQVALKIDTADDRVRLEAHGWVLTSPLQMSCDIFGAYPDFIRRSRAEWTVAKDQNVRLRSGWFSERDVCYLASGKPVVAQDTGFSNHLPTGEGLFAFVTMDECLAAIEAVNANYRRHCEAARAIAEEHFDALKVAGRLLADIGLA